MITFFNLQELVYSFCFAVIVMNLLECILISDVLYQSFYLKTLNYFSLLASHCKAVSILMQTLVM